MRRDPEQQWMMEWLKLVKAGDGGISELACYHDCMHCIPSLVKYTCIILQGGLDMHLSIIIHVYVTGSELGRKNVSDMFYSGELENEIRSRNHVHLWPFKVAGDSDKYMAAIDKQRVDTLYPHTPSTGCSERGMKHSCLFLPFIIENTM